MQNKVTKINKETTEFLDYIKNLKTAIDPDNMLAAWNIGKILCCDNRWQIIMNCQETHQMNIMAKIEDRITIFQVLIDQYELNIKKEETFAKCIDSVPDFLKLEAPKIKKETDSHCLEIIAKQSAKQKEMLLRDVYGKEGKEQLFNMLQTTFLPGAPGKPDIIILKANHGVEYGKITIECEIDIYGIHKKTVSICKDYEDGQKLKTFCKHIIDGETYPSLQLAFELDEVYDGKKLKQRRKKLKRK